MNTKKVILTKRISLDTFFKFACTNLECKVVNLLQATNTSVKIDSDTKSQNPSVAKINTYTYIYIFVN